MFVTFDLATPAERTSSSFLHAALALGLPSKALAELSYEVLPTDRLLFPTFADAGWFSHFRGVPVGEPHGWTNPHVPPGDASDRQPEAVKATDSLNRVESVRFRFVAR